MGCCRSEEIELSNQASIFWPYLFQTVDRKMMKNGFNLSSILPATRIPRSRFLRNITGFKTTVCMYKESYYSILV